MNKWKSLRPSAAAFLLMVSMACTTSGLSFFVSPVCGELGIGRGSFALYYSLMTATGALSTSFLGQYMSRKGPRKVMLVSAVWVFAGLMLFSVSRRLWMFYAVAAAMGLFATSCINLCANVIVQTSYSSDQASNLLGFVMAGSGIGGMILSILLPGILERMGWRFGYRLIAVCWLVLVLLAWLLLGKQQNAAAAVGKAISVDGMTKAEALRSPRFYCMLVAVVLYTAGSTIQQQVPSLLEGMEYSAGQISVMVAVLTAALAVGKIVQGMLYSRIGTLKGGILLSVTYMAGFLMLTNRATVYPGLIALAFGMGTVTTLLPTAVRFTFGAREYAAIWSILATASSVGSFISTPVWGAIYDGFGSYGPGLVGMPLLLAVGMACLIRAVGGKK